MCSSTYMAFSQNTSHPMGRSPLWLFPRTFLNFCHFEGVRMALGQTWFAHMQEPFTRIQNLVLTQKWPSAPMLEIPRTRQICKILIGFLSFQIPGRRGGEPQEMKCGQAGCEEVFFRSALLKRHLLDVHNVTEQQVWSLTQFFFLWLFTFMDWCCEMLCYLQTHNQYYRQLFWTELWNF